MASQVAPMRTSVQFLMSSSSSRVAEFSQHSQHCSESLQRPSKYSLKELLYNIVYVHRAFELSFANSSELFIPVHNPEIVQSSTSHETWLCCELRGRYANQHTINKLPAGFEKDKGINDRFVIRKKKRFQWSGQGDRKLAEYVKYHKKARSIFITYRAPSDCGT